MLMGDMNARIADKQAQPIAWDEIDKTEQVYIANSWQRASQTSWSMHKEGLYVI